MLHAKKGCTQKKSTFLCATLKSWERGPGDEATCNSVSCMLYSEIYVYKNTVICIIFIPKNSYNLHKFYYHCRWFMLHRRSPSLLHSQLMPGAYSSPPCKLPPVWPRRWRERKRETAAAKRKRKRTLPRLMMETFIDLPSSLSLRCIATCTCMCNVCMERSRVSQSLQNLVAISQRHY